MRQDKFLFVILSLVGVNSVMGQFMTTGSSTSAVIYTNSKVGIGYTSLPASLLASLQIQTGAGHSAIFQNATNTAGVGNVGIGGLSTSFTSTSLPTNLLHLRDGNMWVQRGTLRVSTVNATDDALWVSNGRANLAGGVYAGYSGPGVETFMQYIPSVGTFEIKTNYSQINTYDFKIGSIVNNVNLSSPVLSTTQSMIFQTNSGLSTTAYNFKFLNGNTELVTLTNSGNMTLSATTGYNGKINAHQLQLYNSIGDGYDYGAIRMGQSGTNFWHIGQATADNSFRIMRYNGSTWMGALGFDYATGNVTLPNRVDVGGTYSGTACATLKLWVNGNIGAKEVTVSPSYWCDAVFADETYKLPKLNEVEAFIAKNKHLPGSTSEHDIMKNGMKITETAAEQQRHIEHLYLYVLELEKRLAKAETSISRQ